MDLIQILTQENEELKRKVADLEEKVMELSGGHVCDIGNF